MDCPVDGRLNPQILATRGETNFCSSLFGPLLGAELLGCMANVRWTSREAAKALPKV